MLTSKQIEQSEQLTEDYGCKFSRDFDEYLDAIISLRKEDLKRRLEERSIRANSIHRGTKE